MFKQTIKKIDSYYYSEGEATDAFIKSLTGARDASGNLIETSPNASGSSNTVSSNFKPIPFTELTRPDYDKINNKPTTNIDEAISVFIHYFYKTIVRMEESLKTERMSAKDNSSLYAQAINNIPKYKKNIYNFLKENAKFFTYTKSDELGY